LQFIEDILVNENYEVSDENFLLPQTFCESIFWLLHFAFLKDQGVEKAEVGKNYRKRF